MIVAETHSWDISPKEGIELQWCLKKKLKLRRLVKPPETVAGADVSYDKGSKQFFAGVVVLKFPGMEIIDESSAEGIVVFPYIPGLLSFREGPVLLEAFRRLKTTPDVIIFDGQGIAHPRGMGIASHIGLLLDRPSIGCAKTKLCGDFDEPGYEKGSYSPLLMKGEELGVVLRTRSGVKPLLVSPGHLVDIKGSLDIILACSKKYRLPEPTRQAHLFVNRVRRSFKKID